MFFAYFGRHTRHKHTKGKKKPKKNYLAPLFSLYMAPSLSLADLSSYFLRVGCLGGGGEKKKKGERRASCGNFFLIFFEQKKCLGWCVFLFSICEEMFF